MEELIFFAVIIFFSIVESIARKKSLKSKMSYWDFINMFKKSWIVPKINKSITT